MWINISLFSLSMPVFLCRDLRAKLEVAIEKVLNAVRLANTFSRHHRAHTDDDDDDDESSSVPTSDNEEVRRTMFIFSLTENECLPLHLGRL